MNLKEKRLRLVEERSQELELAQGRRDEAILAAVEAGASGPEVGRVAGITRARVWQIVEQSKRAAS